MLYYLLTKRSVMSCMHGGPVIHIPMSYGELVNGELPLLLTDIYNVVGCPNYLAGEPNPCVRVRWLFGSTRRLINGVPVLVNMSQGHCEDIRGVMQGPVIIHSHQMIETEEGSIDSVIKRQLESAREIVARQQQQQKKN